MMNKNSIIAILAALVVLMAIAMMVRDFKDGGKGGINPDEHEGTTAVTNKPVTSSEQGESVSNNYDSIKPEKQSTNGATNSAKKTNQPPPRSLTKPLPVAVTNELPSVKAEDIARLPRKDEPQGLTTLFEVTGKGTLAAAGGAGDVSFY